MQRIRVWACMTLMALLVPVLVACGGTPAAPGASGSAGDSTGASPAASASGEATASPSAAATGEPYTIKFWTISLKPTFETYMNDLIAKYEQAHPGAKIEWSDYPGGEIKQKLLTAIASGDVPDVVNLNTDLTLQVASTNPEILTNMSQAVPQATQQEYFEGLWNATQFKGASYGIPWYATVRVVVYNKQIMQEAGIQQPPKTYDDLAQVAKTVKEKTGNWGYAPNINLVENFLMAGVPLVNEDRTQPAFNTPKGVEVAQYYIDLKNQGLIPEDILAKGYQGELQLYKEGKLAMQLAGASLLKQIEKDAPEVFKNTDVAPHPTREANTLPVALMHLVVPAQSKVQQQAVDFALYVTNAENQLGLAKNSVTVPSIKAGAEDAFFQQEDTLEAKARKIMAEELKIAKDPYLGLANWTDLTKSLNDNYTEAWNGTKTVEQALNDAAEAWKPLLQQ
jgi:putative chitobiose transport system substrate-binding protein